MTQEKKQEMTLKISQANKTQMITILYEMVLEYLDEAMDDLSIGKKEDAQKALSNAQSCIDELIRSLNLKYSLAKDLHKLYIYFKKELIVAGATYSIHKIWRVAQNIKSLCEAYRELEKEDTSAPMMGNIQTVYAGLTYGRNSLNEAVTAGSYNRGFMA
ncbi:flagellar protein FliS [Butyrivibrio proteoclasticus]|uniref:flagellar export chaperone FliS n=1 Tax=Butyrivibrio proteoclasticus TaxID=43305 RepID=UPI00047AC1BD|nr:flagellar protein FliS [Butyrivibrio proteoclasticus]